jgi:hypothetical protein
MVNFTGAFTNNAMSDFMLGQAALFRQTSGTEREFWRWDSESYFQDDWKLSRRVTLNLGLRYELNPWFISRLKDQEAFRPGQQSRVFPTAPPGLVFIGDSGVPDSTASLDKKRFAPRLGVAIDPFGDGKMAVRVGWGIFYATPYADLSTQLQQQPFLVDYSVFGSPNLINPYSAVGSPFPYTLNRQKPLFSYPMTVQSLNPDLTTPYVQQYSFTVQRQLGTDLSFQLAYVGTRHESYS